MGVMQMVTELCFLFILGLLSVAEVYCLTSWDYKQQGADWTVDKNADWKCLATTSTRQSPLNIVSGTTAKPNKTLHVSSTGGYSQFDIEQRLKTIRITPQGHHDELTIGGDPHVLRYYDIRAMSEHYLDGKQQSLEIQYVFLSANTKKKAIMSVLFTHEGIPQQNIHVIDALSALDFTKNAENKLTSFDLRYDSLENVYHGAVRAGTGLQTYVGSGTEPPCDEGVSWFVFEKPIVVFKSLLDRISEKVQYEGTKGNYRDLPTGDLVKGVVLQKYVTYTAKFVSSSSVLSLWVSVVTTGLLAALCM